MLENLILGADAVFQPLALSAIAFGLIWGVFGGMIPGINAPIAMALLLPFTWSMESHIAVMMLAGVYCGGEYGGSIPAILLGTPGTTPAACTVIDGYPLHQQGKSGLALGTSLVASVFGTLFGATALLVLAVPLARIALSFGPSEYFALAVLGLTLICTLAGRNVLKGLLAGLLGLFLSTIGFDPIVGIPRFTFDSPNLSAGFQMISVMMGMFAVAELLHQTELLRVESPKHRIAKSDSRFPGLRKLREILPTVSFASVIGLLIGALPGAGATTAAFVSYSETKRWSRDSHSFGKGNIKGIAAPEAANNAVTGGALVPLLALGIPGSNSTAIMLGALVIHDITPGPLLFRESPEIPYGMFVSLIVAGCLMLPVGYLAIKAAMKMTSIGKPVLIACIMALVCTGAFAYSRDVFDIFVTLGFGLLGFAMRKYGLPLTATVLGFVLGFIMEVNLRRALIITQGDLVTALFNSTLSGTLLILASVSLMLIFWKNLKSTDSAN